MLCKATEDYEAKKFVAKSENTTVDMLLDMWVEEERKPGDLRNGRVLRTAYVESAASLKGDNMEMDYHN